MGGILYIGAEKLETRCHGFVIHPGFDDEELRAATRERSTWGSAWRQRDYDFFTSDQFREILAQQKIKLITWRELLAPAKQNNLSDFCEVMRIEEDEAGRHRTRTCFGRKFKWLLVQPFVIVLQPTRSALPNYSDCLCSVQAFTLPSPLLFDVA